MQIILHRGVIWPGCGLEPPSFALPWQAVTGLPDAGIAPALLLRFRSHSDAACPPGSPNAKQVIGLVYSQVSFLIRVLPVKEEFPDAIGQEVQDP